MKVLVVNAGSSSLKYQLLDTESGKLLANRLATTAILAADVDYQILFHNGAGVRRVVEARFGRGNDAIVAPKEARLRWPTAGPRGEWRTILPNCRPTWCGG